MIERVKKIFLSKVRCFKSHYQMPKALDLLLTPISNFVIRAFAVDPPAAEIFSTADAENACAVTFTFDSDFAIAKHLDWQCYRELRHFQLNLQQLHRHP
jgi:hypothetical protein